MPYGNPFGNEIDPGELADGAVTLAKLEGAIPFTALTPAASITIPASQRAVSLTPDQATEIDLETAGVEDGTTKLLRVAQGATGYSITFAAGIAEVGGTASSISAGASAVSYASFIYNADAARWECYGVASA